MTGAGGPLGPLAGRPARAGVFSDFDGTLARIVDEPEQARPVAGARDALARAAGRMRRVGVISGRPASFLQAHIGAPGVALWGLHGLESVHDGKVAVAQAARPWRPVVEQAVVAARNDLGPHVEVEAKSVAITIHYRRAPAEAPRVEAWIERTAASTGLVAYPARMSCELRPPVPHGKGVTLEAAAAGLEAVCFLGDDASDVAGFEALDRLETAGAVAVRVAVASAEAPPQLLARADVVVDGPEAAVALLRTLVD